MMIFATPDFGASGVMCLFLLIGGVFVFLLVSVGILRGFRLLGSESAKARRYGVVLLLAAGLLSVACCLGPSLGIRLIYGNYPLGSYPNNKIQEGMTRDEVAAILGSPHEKFKTTDEESWYYWIDSFGVSYFGVRFGPAGRVIGTHGN